MTGAPFVRLGFIVCVTGYLLGLVLVSRWQGWPAGLGVAGGGVIAAVLLFEDWGRQAQAGAEPRRGRHLARAYGTDD